jgi:hypothetical protein
VFIGRDTYLLQPALRWVMNIINAFICSAAINDSCSSGSEPQISLLNRSYILTIILIGRCRKSRNESFTIFIFYQILLSWQNQDLQMSEACGTHNKYGAHLQNFCLKIEWKRFESGTSPLRMRSSKHFVIMFASLNFYISCYNHFCFKDG